MPNERCIKSASTKLARRDVGSHPASVWTIVELPLNLHDRMSRMDKHRRLKILDSEEFLPRR